MTLRSLVALLGRLVWSLGRWPPEFNGEAHRQRWFCRYGMAAVVPGLLFFAWEAAYRPGWAVLFALHYLDVIWPPPVRAAGALLLLLVAATRVLLAALALGLTLALLRPLLYRRS